MVGKEGRKKKEGRQAKHSWSEELEGGMRRHSLGVASTCGNFCEKMEKKKKKSGQCYSFTITLRDPLIGEFHCKMGLPFPWISSRSQRWTGLTFVSCTSLNLLSIIWLINLVTLVMWIQSHFYVCSCCIYIDITLFRNILAHAGCQQLLRKLKFNSNFIRRLKYPQMSDLCQLLYLCNLKIQVIIHVIHPQTLFSDWTTIQFRYNTLSWF